MTDAAHGRPRVVVLCQMIYPEEISTGQVITELCVELQRLGADVEVLAGPMTIVDQQTTVPRYMTHKGVRIERVWGTRFPKLNFWGKLANQLSYGVSTLVSLLKQRSDAPVMVLTNPPFLPVLCAVVSALRQRQFVVLFHDVYPEVAVATGHLREGGGIAMLWERVNRVVLGQASGAIVIGRCMQELIASKLPPEARERVHLVHLWSDQRHVRSVPRAENPYLATWGLEGKFVLLYSGNMGRFHDLETIVEAAQRLRAHPQIQFLFVGEGHKKSWAMAEVARHGLTNCRFEGYVPRDDLPYSLSVAHVGLVSLALGQEASCVPSKTYGLLAAGKPVLAILSRNSEIARMVEEEECGVVIEPGDVESLTAAIIDLYNRPDKLEQMTIRARRAADERYSIERAAKKYFQIISDLQ